MITANNRVWMLNLLKITRAGPAFPNRKAERVGDLLAALAIAR
jgi:hypothetical protein